MLHADLPGGLRAATSSAWAQSLVARSDTRVSVVVRIPQDRLSPPPVGVSAGGPWAVLWSEAAPPTALRATAFDELSAVGPQEDVVAAVLWGVVHALETGGASGRVRLPVVSDARGSRPLDATAFERRACLTRFVSGTDRLDPALEGRVVEPAWARVSFGVQVQTPADVHIVAADSGSVWRDAAVPRVLVGPQQVLEAALDWTGPGRLTVKTSAERPETALVAAHLVAARQAWLQAGLAHEAARLPDWEPVVSPSLLGLCGAALQGRCWALIPEPAPSSADRQQLSEMVSGTGITVHTPTSVHGQLLAGWTVHLVCRPPTPLSARRLGLPPTHAARVRRVLEAVFALAGGEVHLVDTPDALLHALPGPRQQLHVLCGLPATGPLSGTWLSAVRTLVTAHEGAVYPLGLCGGLFGLDPLALERAWPDALSRIADHNGLGLARTESLVRTIDTWPAARRVLEGVGRLLG